MPVTRYRRPAAALAACILLLGAWAILSSTDLGGPGFLHGLLLAVNQLQRRLYEVLASAIQQTKSSSSPWPLLALFGASFVYGVFHAVGPGHGKVVISSYLVASGGEARQGLLLCLASSLVQAASAVALVAVLALLLDFSRLEIDQEGRLVEEVSYGLIILLGAWMMISSLRPEWSGGHDHRHHFPKDPARGVATTAGGRTTRARWRRYAAVVLATGIRPCSGAILVLLFTLAQGLFLAGIGATLVMALGTSITISILAILALLSRRAALRVAGEDSRWRARIGSGLGVLSAVAVVAAGSLLLLATISQPASL